MNVQFKVILNQRGNRMSSTHFGNKIKSMKKILEHFQVDIENEATDVFRLHPKDVLKNQNLSFILCTFSEELV